MRGQPLFRLSRERRPPSPHRYTQSPTKKGGVYLFSTRVSGNLLHDSFPERAIPHKLQLNKRPVLPVLAEDEIDRSATGARLRSHNRCCSDDRRLWLSDRKDAERSPRVAHGSCTTASAISLSVQCSKQSSSPKAATNEGTWLCVVGMVAAGYSGKRAVPRSDLG